MGMGRLPGSVTNALAVLCALAEEGEIGVSQMAAGTGLPKSMVHRILTTLKEELFVVQDPSSKKYAVGPMACAVGQAFLAQNSIYSATASCLADDLREQTSFVGYLDGYETVTVAARQGSGTVSIQATGSRAYVHTTAVGKVMAAHLPQSEIERRFSAWQFPRVTPYTIDSYERFARELAVIRKRGYATVVEELDLGVASIRAPIWGPDRVVAGVSIAYALGTVDEMRHRGLVDLIVASAAKASMRLGGMLTPMAGSGSHDGGIDQGGGGVG
jgi:DNA-binding IclR family transcriptional regulator